mgnify:CR=1 FL=1
MTRYLDLDEWQVQEIQLGLHEAGRGEFASPEEVQKVLSRWIRGGLEREGRSRGCCAGVARIYEALVCLQTNPQLGRVGRVAGTRELVVPDSRY